MSLVRVRGDIDLEVDGFGRPHAPLVLLVPGAGAPLEFWPEEVCRGLAAAGLHVVRYSHRDTGLSAHLDAAYPIMELVRDMTALVARLGTDRVHLVGHSMGGYLAQMAMCREPGVVVSATAISAGPTVDPAQQEELGMSPVPDATWRVLMQNRPTGDLARDLPGWLASWRFLNGARPFDDDAAVRYTRALYRGDPRNALVAEHHVHAMTTVPRTLDRELSEAVRPLLVIHGTDDPLVPVDHGEASARLAPDGSLVRLDGAGHMFFDAATWDEIAHAVLAHVQRCETLGKR